VMCCRYVKLAGRISSCLLELLKTRHSLKDRYLLVKHAWILNKCLKAGLWENSVHVAKQMDKIGEINEKLLIFIFILVITNTKAKLD
jgi:hypothetical protein